VGIGIRAIDVEHSYQASDETGEVLALRGATLTIPEGDFVALMGPSGSGKSTLLHLLGAIERPTTGSIFHGDIDIARLSENELTARRRSSIGFVFQFFHLVTTLTVAENVAFPLRLLGVRSDEIAARVTRMLGRVGLAPRASHYPSQLSGGEMQRAAIARAVIHEPPLILADEPTGNLDSRTGSAILELLSEIHETDRPTIVMATHSQAAGAIASRIVPMVDGVILPAGQRP
jgi:putative ABC transport system ATP-binding protein